MTIFYLLLLTIPLPLKLYWDHTSWKEGYKINHPQRYMVVGAFMILVSYIVWKLGPAKYMAQTFMLSIGIFWMFFDYIINLAENRDWFFIPDPDDENASWTDRKIYAKLGVWKLLLARIVFLGLALTFNHWIF